MRVCAMINRSKTTDELCFDVLEARRMIKHVILHLLDDSYPDIIAKRLWEACDLLLTQKEETPCP